VTGLAASKVGAGTVVAHVTGSLVHHRRHLKVSATGDLGEPTWQWLLTH